MSGISKNIFEQNNEKNRMISEMINLNDLKINSIYAKNNTIKKFCETKNKITKYLLFNKNKNINKEKIKQRNPGVDLVRIIASFFIILSHLIFIGKAIKKYSKYKKHLKILHSLTDWHNNGFALVSGIIGYKANKYSNLLYLWFTVFFLFSRNTFIYLLLQKKLYYK